jgi:hypothetical protein
MRIIFLVSLLIITISPAAQAQRDSISYGRLAVVSAGAVSVLGGSYAYIQNSWWNEKAVAFHFDDGSDLRYAKNIDKGGHFMGGALVSEMFQSSLQWSGVREKNAYWYGAAMGSFVQAAIEMKDAYAPYWGFSLWDFGAGSVGALVPLGKRYWKPMQKIETKMSYYKRSNHYWDLGTAQKPYAPPHPHAYQDDYINQTYWLSYFPLREKNFPIGISVGVGLDDTQYLNEKNTKVGGQNEWYVALDYDWEQLLQSWDSRSAKKLKKWLQYIKLPAPTIRVSPELEFYPFFM